MILGDVAIPGLAAPTFSTPVVRFDASIMTNPTGLEEMWNDRNSGGDFDVSVWNPVPAFGFTCVGNIAVGAYTTEPPRNQVFCLHPQYLLQDVIPTKIWDDTRSGIIPYLWTFVTLPINALFTGASMDGSLWGTTSGAGQSAGIETKTFFTRRSHQGPGYNKQFWLNPAFVQVE